MRLGDLGEFLGAVKRMSAPGVPCFSIYPRNEVH